MREQNWKSPPARNTVIRTLASRAPDATTTLTDAIPLTACETASIVGVNPNTLTKWRQRQERGEAVPITIPFHRRGKNVFYRMADVIAALTGQTQEQEPAPC